MIHDTLPIWALLLVTIGLVALALEASVRLSRWRQLRAGGKSEAAGAMVGATMALLAFMLAFTFNGAAARHDARKALVIEEANAIDKAWLRAGFLPDPHRNDMREMLRSYVDLRVDAAVGAVDIGAATQQSEALHARMWAIAEEVGKQEGSSRSTGLFIQSLNDVFDLHLKRLTVATRSRVPATIWVTLYLLLAVGMVMMGTQIGLGATRHYGMEVALAVSFSVVLCVIADLDRPQEGLINVSQAAMEDLQTRLKKY